MHRDVQQTCADDLYPVVRALMAAVGHRRLYHGRGASIFVVVAGFLNLVVGFLKSHLNLANLTAFQPKSSIILGFETFSVGFFTKWISHRKTIDAM
jgi:hypothetical protein